jgi:hypothetical protein
VVVADVAVQDVLGVDAERGEQLGGEGRLDGLGDGRLGQVRR